MASVSVVAGGACVRTLGVGHVSRRGPSAAPVALPGRRSVKVKVYGDPDFTNLPSFRPPPKQGTGMAKEQEDEYIARLKGRGAWPDLGRIVNEMYDKGGYTSYSLEKATGLTANELNMYSTSARVLETIVNDGGDTCLEATQWAAESGDGMAVVYELRVMSTEQRPGWLSMLYDKGDTSSKDVRAYMKLAKDVERKPAAQRKGFDLSLPGDTLSCAYANFALKVDALDERLNYLKKANKYAQSEGSKARLVEVTEFVMRVASGMSVAGSGMTMPFLPLAALPDMTELSRTVPYTEDMSMAGLISYGRLLKDEEHTLGVKAFGAVRVSSSEISLCSVPSSIPIAAMTDPIAVGLKEARGLCPDNIPIPDPSWPLLLLVDRDQKQWGEDMENGREYYLCRSDGTTAHEATLRSVRAGKPESDEDIIGRCVCVYRPPLPDRDTEGYVSEDEWYD